MAPIANPVLDEVDGQSFLDEAAEQQEMIYLQAHHLDLEFYDAFYKPGAYLRTHAQHMARWHGATGCQI